MTDTENDGRGNQRRTPTRSKVAQLLSEYEIQEFGDELEAQWLGSGEGRASLRKLAAALNEKMLHKKMVDAGLDPLSGEVENIYQLLTDSEVISGDVTDARRRLERRGIDVDQLKNDFVSRQAIHTYLTKVRGVSHESEPGDALESTSRTINQLQDRTKKVASSKLSQLDSNDIVSIGSARVLVDVHVLCEQCGERYTFDGFLTEGSCDCAPSNVE